MKIKGIVLKETVTKESDRVLTILTENGILRAYAKAAKNIKSKKFTATSQFSYSEFILLEGKDLYKVTESSEIEIFYNLRTDIEILSLAQYFAELIIATVSENGDYKIILRLLLNSLYFLCNSENIYKIKTVFEMRLMAELGFMPDITACCECGEYTAEYMYFNIADSSIVCCNCTLHTPVGAYKLTRAQTDIMRYIFYSDFNKIFNFTASEESLRYISSISEKYVENIAEKTFKTLNYFNSIRIY